MATEEMESMSDAVKPALRYVEAHRDEFLAELKDLLRIPSISTLPRHRKDIRRAARFVADQLSAIGLRRVKVIKTEGHPLVYGEWLDAPGKPTVLLYGHYDVQPVDPIDLWQSPPFEPEVRDGNLYARGAVDDKGQMLAIIKALEALLRTSGALPVNVRVLIEGEEEAGGESIEAYVKAFPRKLGCDVAVIVDSSMPAEDVPSITYGVRGIVYTEIEARGAKRDLHSGEFGGVAPNPLHALALVLAGLKDAQGHIHIPGLYEHAAGPTEEERALWARHPVDMEAVWKHEMGLDVLPGEPEYAPLERGIARTTLEVHGIVGGFIGDGAKTVIPAEARAKVSLRLVPGQRPADVFKLLEQRVRQLCPPGITLSVRTIHGGDAVVVPVEHAFIRATARALEQEWGRAPALERSGGSIPIAALFHGVLGVPVVFLGTGLPDDNIHAPNEKFKVEHYYRDINQLVRVLDIFGSDPAVASRPNVSARASRPARQTAAARASANGAAKAPGRATKSARADAASKRS
jgi:acetylornithine deacetylase/succinyl-diaminopimelate desuccinylase-like protein